jgi:DNA-binding NtrC family response regulator
MTTEEPNRVLIVDDEDVLRVTLSDDLSDAGFDVTACGRSEEAKSLLSNRRFDVVVTDMRVSGELDGLEIIEQAKQIDGEISVVVMTAYGSVANAVRAMKVGADDYLTKPFDSEELVLLLRRIQRLATLKRENWELREKLSEQQKFEEIIAVSNVMSDVVKRLAIVAPTDETILLSGESGTGKELAARCIHQGLRNARSVALKGLPVGPYFLTKSTTFHWIFRLSCFVSFRSGNSSESAVRK